MIDEAARSPGKSWLDPLLKCVSLAGLAALLFIGGATASYYKVFPYHQLDRAVVAARALLKLVRGEPATFVRYAPSLVASPKGPATERLVTRRRRADPDRRRAQRKSRGLPNLRLSRLDRRSQGCHPAQVGGRSATHPRGDDRLRGPARARLAQAARLAAPSQRRSHRDLRERRRVALWRRGRPLRLGWPPDLGAEQWRAPLDDHRP